MEAEYTEPGADYLKGFNEGFLIAKHLPEVAAAMSNQLSDSEHSKGFLNGMEQFSLDIEPAKDFMLDWAQPYTADREADKDMDNDMERDDMDMDKD